jgi:hypothetical protein
MWEAIVITCIWFVAGLAYYHFYSRHRLTMSPEERLAISLAVTSEKMLVTPLGFRCKCATQSIPSLHLLDMYLVVLPSYLLQWCTNEHSEEQLACWKVILFRYDLRRSKADHSIH